VFSFQGTICESCSIQFHNVAAVAATSTNIAHRYRKINCYFMFFC
jgi:hypothetical protein